MRKPTQTCIILGLFIALLVAAYRVFFVADFDMVGHNWDWTVPAIRAQLDHIDVVSQYLWKRSDLGAPSYLVGVHLFANVAVRFLALLLTPKWVIFTLFLVVHAVALWSFKRLTDYLVRPSPWNYLPATLYAFSPILFNDITGGSWYTWVSYAFLPWHFLSVLKFFKDGQARQLLAAVVTSSMTLLATQNFVSITLILLAYIIRLLLRRELKWRITLARGALFVVVLAALNFYWIIGQGYALGDLWKNQVLSEKGFGGWGQQRGQTQTILHIFSLVGYWDRHMYLYALPWYLNVLFLGTVAGTWLAIGLHVLRARGKQLADVLFWLTLFLVFAFFAKARNQPLGELTMKIFESVPLLRIFRTPYHLMRPIAFILPLLMALAFHFFYHTAARRRAVTTLFSLMVLFWIGGWWYNGDLGSRTLLAQRRDHVDFFRLSPEIRAAYETNERTSLAHRVLFLPTVESPLFLKTEYQESAQGGIPEYDYLKNPTLSAESNRSSWADIVDRSLCTDEPRLSGGYMALLNIGRVILRKDIVPQHTWCLKRWNYDRVAATVRAHADLQAEDSSTYRIRPESFLPLFYTPSTLQIVDAPVDYLFRLVDRVKTGARRAIVFRDQNSRLPDQFTRQAELHLPGLKPDPERPRVQLPLSRDNSHRRFSLRRTLSAAHEEGLVITYDQRARQTVFSFDASSLRLNDDRDIDSIHLAAVPAEPGDLVSVGDRIFTIKENMRVTLSLAAEVRVLRQVKKLFAESFTSDIAPSDEFINCSSGKQGSAPLQAQLVTDEATDRRALELATDGVDTTCFRRAYRVDLQPEGLYVFSADYQNTAGGLVQLHFDAGLTDVIGDTLFEDDGRWHTYQRLFKTTAPDAEAQVYLYAPQTDGRKAVVNRFTDLRLAQLDVVARLNLLDYVPPLQQGTWNSVIKDDLSFGDSQAWLATASEQADRSNLLADSSFETGLWREKPGDCHAQPQPGDVWQAWSADATDGQHSLELGAKSNHGACTSQVFSVRLQPDNIYKFAFDYKSVRGGAVQFSYSNHESPETTDDAKIKHVPDNEWRTYESFVSPKTASDVFEVYFYAPGDPALTKNGSVVRYDNVRLLEWVPRSSLNYYLESPPEQPTTPPANISFRPLNPTKYRVRVQGASGPFLLAFSEAFHPDWKVYPQPAATPLERFANRKTALRAVPTRRTGVVGELWPATLTELTSYIRRGWVGDEGSVAAFISKQLNGALQDDNLPRGRFWETWGKKPVFADSQLTVNGYANGWWVEPAALCQRESDCVQNPDHSYDFELIVEFWPQRLRYIGLAVSGLSLFGLLSYLGRQQWRKYRLAKP